MAIDPATAVVPLPSTTNDAPWNRLDANKDGWLSESEAKGDATVQAAWKNMDRDNNSRIKRTELNGSYASRVTRALAT